MTGLRAFFRPYSAPTATAGWRGVLWLGFVAAIVVAVPEARALMAAGFAGGVVIGAFLILMRHQGGPSGPRRGTPIVLFPRSVNLSPNGA